MSDEIKREFLEEASELLHDSDQMLDTLNNDPCNQDAIDQLFRNLHTVKGSSGVVGFMELSSYLHKIEDLIDGYRSLGEVPNNAVSTLVTCNDFASDWVDKLIDDYDYYPDTSPLEELLSELYGGQFPEGSGTSLEAGFQSFEEESPCHATVLIVDDEPTILKIMETYLAEFPFKILTAGSGEDALNIYQNNEIDVIVSDLKMPGISGVEFIRKVREIDTKVEVIFLSAQADRESMEQFIKLRTFGFVDKAEAKVEISNTVLNAAKAKKVSDAIAILTKLNFEIYMDFNLLQSGRQVNNRIRNNLEKVARLTSMIGDPDLILGTNLKDIA